MKRLRIHEHFVTLQDPRIERTKRHALMDVVVIAILAVIAGADGWDDIEQFADARSRWLKTFLALRGGVPCADTFRRVFAALDAEEFQRCVLGWMCELADGLSGKLVAIDGKTARGSFGDGRGPLHLVSAWVAENSLALAQISVEDKSNEIVAIPRLLALLDLRGATVTIDAMGCQKAIAAAIVDRGADYVLALKDNHPTLHAEVAEFFADAEKSKLARDTAHSSDETTDGGHGRVEVRRVWASDEIEWLDPKGAWKGLRSIVMVERERTARGQTSIERAYYLTSCSADAAKLGDIVRRHWSIENSLHWTLDVTFDEDSSRIRSKNGVQNFAALRKIALALLKREASKAKLSVAQKRKRAGYLTEYLLVVLRGANAAGALAPRFRLRAPSARSRDAELSREPSPPSLVTMAQKRSSRTMTGPTLASEARPRTTAASRAAADSPASARAQREPTVSVGPIACRPFGELKVGSEQRPTELFGELAVTSGQLARWRPRGGGPRE